MSLYCLHGRLHGRCQLCDVVDEVDALRSEFQKLQHTAQQMSDALDAALAREDDLKARLREARALLVDLAEGRTSVDDADWSVLRATDLRVKNWRGRE